MHSPPLQLHPVSTTHYFVSGDVTIHEGAAIAPGVLLQADPNSRIVIHAGACIGMGSVLHAHNGTIEIGEGSILGSGVLLVGALKISDRACIGSATTIFNQSVERGVIIAPSSLLGVDAPTNPNVSSQTPVEEVYEPGFCPPCPTPESNNGSKPAESTNGAKPVEPENSPEVPESENLPEESDEIDSPVSQNSSSALSQNGSVYGQSYVNELLGKLFPHQQHSNNSPADGN